MSDTRLIPAAPPCELIDERDPFAVEINLSRVHAATADWHPALRESACLAAQFPAMLARLEAGEVFFGQWYGGFGGTEYERAVWEGRHDFVARPIAAIGFSAKSNAAAVLGYYYFRQLIQVKLAQLDPAPERRAELEHWMAYWEEQEPAKLLREAYPPVIAERLPSDAWTQDSHPAFPLYRLAGLQLDYGKLLRLGLPGLRQAIEDSPADEVLKEAWRRSLEVVVASARRGAGEATALPGAEAARIAEACAAICERPPQTLHEAIQLIILYKHCATVENWSRLDDILGPFLCADLEAGRLSPGEAQGLVDALWRFIAESGNRFNERVMVGGRGRRHAREADVFARYAIQATRNVHEVLPQLALRFHPDQDPELYALALTALGEGRTLPMLYNDAVGVPGAMRAFSVDEATAEQYIPFGCGEYVLDHRSVGTPSGVINCCKVLEVTLRDSIDPLTGERVAPERGHLRDFADFEQLWQAYAANMDWYLEALAHQQKMQYDWGDRVAGFNLAALLMDDCLARGKTLLGGGVQHLGGTMESYGDTNAADSLHVIRKLIYEGEVSADEMLAALDDDFAGHDALRNRIEAIAHYGNDDPAADAMAVRVHEQVCTCTAAQAAKVGLDSYLVVVINNSANTVLGHQTAASADGRRAGESLANANNPSAGRDRSGATAFLNSLVKLDPGLLAGAVQNMKFNRSLFNETQRPKLEALLSAYWQQGGAQAMITVVSPDDLQQAMEHPEQWQHLMVRVGGFSARFVELPRDVQADIAARTMHE